MQKIKVSVIIPVYNSEVYLKQCIESVLNQTLKDIEIICIDDGSTDDSVHILEKYARKDSRLKVLKQINQYAGVARNNGMKEAKGKYLSFLDSDDYFELDMLEIAYNEAERRNTDILIFQAEFFDSATNKILPSHWLVREDNLPLKEVFNMNDIKSHIFDMSLNVAWNKLIKREFVKKNSLEFQPIIHTNDTYFICMAMSKAERVSYINNRLLHYRRNIDTSLSSSSTRQDNPFVIYCVLAEIQLKLKQMNIYEKVKQSFSNFALDQLIFNLSMVDGTAYLELYKNIRESWLNEFDILNHSQDYFYYHDKYVQLQKIENGTVVSPYSLSEYSFESLKNHITKDLRVIIYGAGKVGRELYKKASIEYGWNIVLWVDNNYEKLRSKGYGVSPVESMNNTQYDKVVIAVLNDKLAKEICKELVEQNIKENSLEWNDYSRRE